MEIENCNINDNSSACDINSQPVQEKYPYRKKIRRWYARLLAKHPWVAFLSTFLMVVVAGASSFVKELGAKSLPDFSLPSKGFEARGTLISRRIIAHNNLYSQMPGVDRLPTSSYLPRLERTVSKQQNASCSHHPLPYLSSKTVYKSLTGEDLLNVKDLISICSMERDLIRKDKLFESECIKGVGRTQCCPSLSIGYYVAILNNKSNCFAITDRDVGAFKSFLQQYKKLYDAGNLTKGCLPSNGNVEPDCPRREIANIVFQFMVDKNYLTSSNLSVLTYTLVFSSINPSTEFVRDLYTNKFKNQKLPVKDGIILAAYDFENMKTTAYDNQLLTDVWYIMLAVGLILALMWAYSGSIFISVMGFCSVLFAIILSYWFYTVIFGLTFFPFLNIMTAIFVVGIGADDIFVYVLAWRHARQESTKTPNVKNIATWTEYALYHATAAMFVTSFTTATAFYAGLSSSITAMQCFSVFAGTSILTNYFLMITWLPAIIITQERFFAPFICQKPNSKRQTHPGTSVLSPEDFEKRNRNRFLFAVVEVKNTFKQYSEYVFREWLAKAVVKLNYCWLFLFLVLAVFGMLSLTLYPKLSLPTTQSIPLFIEDHSIEKYDSYVKEKLQIDATISTSKYNFPVIFVWGAREVDNGYFLDPDSTGSTEWDESFNLTKKLNQKSMLTFCNDVKSRSFYSKVRNRESWCFMEDFNTYLKMPCSSSPSNAGCCGKEIPMPEGDFKRCTLDYVQWKKKSFPDLPIKLGPHGEVEALIYKFQSTRDYVLKFSPVQKFWKEIKGWSDERISKMPAGLNKGWVISNLYFYDLQQSIAEGTVKTIAISIGISAIVLLITTQNIIITFYAVVAITAIVSVTIGSLVMAGWQLNILESMTMSVAVGLSIDFTLHYGVAYFNCDISQTRKERVRYSLWHVGSAVAMGTVTTFLAGLVMMPSVIHAYIQVGHFLMLIMSTSWVYSTFFFLALCSVLGPQGHIGDIMLCWKIPFTKSNKVTDVKITKDHQSNTNSSKQQVFSVYSKE